MIISHLDGGLGNQMFQYATGKLIAKQNNVEFYVNPSYLLAFRFYREWNRSPEILKMRLTHGIASKKNIRKFIFATGISYIDMYLRRFKLFEKNVHVVSNDILKNSESMKNSYLFRFLYGDFFDDIKGELKKEFCLKDKRNILSLLNEIKKGESVSIHVRRGDLLKIKNGYVLPIDYYKKAVRHLMKKKKMLKFYIFSDDIDWCEKNFEWINNKIFVKGNSVAEDFELMKNCKYHILANSSLSWWVGYLSGAKGVVAPKHFGFIRSDSRFEMLLYDWVSF